MEKGIFALVPEARLRAVLGNLQAFTDLTIQLIDHDGSLLLHSANPPVIVQS